MECPSCRLIDPDTAIRWDCGHDFRGGQGHVARPESWRVRVQKAQDKMEHWCALLGAVLGGGLVLGWWFVCSWGGAALGAVIGGILRLGTRPTDP
jgi:hypothetical protein